MKIPRQHIESQKSFVEKLESTKFIHYRDLYKNIDRSNFQVCTKVDFKAIEMKPEHKSIHETWGRLKHESVLTYEHTSKTGSQYFIDDNDNVYRFSNHWGAVASCEWTREGKGQLMMSIFESGDWEIGVANLKDFKIFRRKNDRRVDVILNPEWINQMKKVIPTRKKLATLKGSPDFLNLPVEDKKFIGENYGFFNSRFKEIES
jgi:hypothetical protein